VRRGTPEAYVDIAYGQRPRVPGAAHEPQREQPDAVNALLTDLCSDA